MALLEIVEMQSTGARVEMHTWDCGQVVCVSYSPYHPHRHHVTTPLRSFRYTMRRVQIMSRAFIGPLQQAQSLAAQKS